MSDESTLDDFISDGSGNAEPGVPSVRLENHISIIKGTKPERVVDEPGESTDPYLVVSSLTDDEQKYTPDVDGPKATPQDTMMIMDGSKSGRVYPGEHGVIGSTMAAIRPEDTNPEYLRYFLESNFNRLNSATKGSAVPHTDKDLLRGLEVPKFPAEEQRKIATVLYNVDQAIQKTEEIVKQNRQLKLGVVQDIFSNGFTNEPSRSEWFGPVPSDWEVIRLDELAHVTKLAGYEYTNDFDYDEEGDIIAIRALNLKGNRLNLDNELKYITEENAEELERSKLSEGDVAMTYVGAYIGESGYIPESNKFTLGPNVSKMSPNERLMGKYLHQALQTKQLKTQIKARQSSTGQPALSMSKIRKLEIPLPGLEEQQKIIEVLEEFDRRHMHETDVIDQYQRLKQGLMQELLSGTVRTTDTNIEVPDEIAQHG